VTYTFRNRFKIGGNRYAVDGHEYVLAEPPSDDGRVVLKSGSGQAISQTDELILQGSGYPDFDAAKAAGEGGDSTSPKLYPVTPRRRLR
jgi:hypothetical protein